MGLTVTVPFSLSSKALTGSCMERPAKVGRICVRHPITDAALFSEFRWEERLQPCTVLHRLTARFPPHSYKPPMASSSAQLYMAAQLATTARFSNCLPRAH